MKNDLLDTMKQRLADAEADAAQLRKAIAVLQGSDVPKAANGRRKAQSPTVTPVAEPAKVVPVGKLLKMIDEQDGRSATELARETGGDQKAILALLKESEAAGKLTRTGERRGTRWHLTNDA